MGPGNGGWTDVLKLWPEGWARVGLGDKGRRPPEPVQCSSLLPAFFCFVTYVKRGTKFFLKLRVCDF